MIISWTYSSLSALQPKSRTQWLVLENKFHHSSPYIYVPIFLIFHATVNYDNILDKFEYEHSMAKVKVTVATFRKTLSSFYNLHLWVDFDVA